MPKPYVLLYILLQTMYEAISNLVFIGAHHPCSIHLREPFGGASNLEALRRPSSTVGQAQQRKLGDLAEPKCGSWKIHVGRYA